MPLPTKTRLRDLVQREASQNPPDSEDAAILAVAGELCQEVGVDNSPVKIDWAISRGMSGASRSTSFLAPDTIIWADSLLELQRGMKGRLDAEEWKPLLASSLIYDRRLRGKLLLRELMFTILPGFLASLFLGFGVILPELQWAFFVNSSFYLILWSLPIFVIFGAIVLQGSRISKSLHLQADREAAGLVGKEKFVSTLSKIQGLNLKQLERWRPDYPKLSARLRNLDQI
ncbi:MAG TPA: hypothetical protein VE177_03065 [Candidatus Binatus sp.]|nr:hypothetical protein [Candidatus Binatus sp.]